jgi:hypothetical protein
MTITGGILFREEPYTGLDELKEERMDKISSSHQNSAIDDIPDIEEDEFVERTMNAVGLNIPSFDYDKLRKEEHGSPGNERLWVKLLVSGNVDLLEYPPETDYPEVEVGDVNGNWLEWRVSIEEKTGDEVSQEIEEKLDDLQEGLDALRPRLEEMNDELREQAREEYQTRMEKSEKHSETIENIDVTTPDEKED